MTSYRDIQRAADKAHAEKEALEKKCKRNLERNYRRALSAVNHLVRSELLEIGAARFGWNIWPFRSYSIDASRFKNGEIGHYWELEHSGNYSGYLQIYLRPHDDGAHLYVHRCDMLTKGMEWKPCCERPSRKQTKKC